MYHEIWFLDYFVLPWMIQTWFYSSRLNVAFNPSVLIVVLNCECSINCRTNGLGCQTIPTNVVLRLIYHWSNIWLKIQNALNMTSNKYLRSKDLKVKLSPTLIMHVGFNKWGESIKGLKKERIEESHFELYPMHNRITIAYEVWDLGDKIASWWIHNEKIT